MSGKILIPLLAAAFLAAPAFTPAAIPRVADILMAANPANSSSERSNLREANAENPRIAQESVSKRMGGGGGKGSAPATTVKSSKSNTSDRMGGGGGKGSAARATTVKSSKSNTSDRMGGGGGKGAAGQ